MPRKQTVTVDGMGLLARKLDKLPRSVGEGVKAAVREETGQTRHDMIAGAPVDSGDLVESIKDEITKDGLGGIVAATARHATFVEHGTEDTPAQPFAAPAAEHARRRFPDRVKQKVGVELKELVV